MRRSIKWQKPIIILLAIINIAGCSSSQGKNENYTENRSDPYCAKNFIIDQSYNHGPLKITIINAGIIEKSDSPPKGAKINNMNGHVMLGLEIRNTFQNKVYFFPESIEITLNTGEKIAVDIGISDGFGEEFERGRIKRGLLQFPFLESRPEKITTLNILLPGSQDENKNPLTKQQEVTIELTN